MAIFFIDDPSGKLIDSQIMINLQEFASDIAASGAVCPGEISHHRPGWESWIVASTKRRALFTTYLFDNIVCSLNGLPTYLNEELEALPAPASKALWEASDRGTWEAEYGNHLVDWAGGALRMDELWRVPEFGTVERRRVDKWLSSVDEFGMILFAVTSGTPGDESIGLVEADRLSIVVAQRFPPSTSQIDVVPKQSIQISQLPTNITYMRAEWDVDRSGLVFGNSERCMSPLLFCVTISRKNVHRIAYCSSFATRHHITSWPWIRKNKQ